VPVVETYLVRVWLPDRPGALGQVASRIGAVRGDVVGIDILERGAGRAIDELIVSLPDGSLVELLVAEIAQVDGVDVEDVRAIADPSAHDARLDALESAARLVDSVDGDALLELLCGDACADLDADWAAVVDVESAGVGPSVGAVPSGGWLAAFLAGSRASEAVASGQAGPDDVAWAPMPAAGRELILGRRGRPFRSRERRQLAALTRIADRCWERLLRRV